MPSATVDNVLSGGENLMTEKYHPYLNASPSLGGCIEQPSQSGCVAETGAQYA